MKIALAVGVCIFFLISANQAQSTLDEELAALERALDELDSASILSLLDSLIRLEETDENTSQLALRLSYTSQIVSAGRDLGLDQFGLSYGFSYFHKSGIFADFTGYSNSQINPQYYLNMASLGYLGSIGKNWTWMVNYDRYLYNRQQESTANTLFENGFGLSVYAGNDHFDSGFDYSVILGDTTAAHRINWTTNAVVKFDKFLFFDKLMLMPSFSMLFGNGISYLQPFTQTDVEALRARLIQSNTRLRDLINDPERLRREIEEINTFGLLNYGLSIPVSLRLKNLNVLLIYQYNIPVELPGQSEDLEPSSFVNATVSYFIQL